MFRFEINSEEVEDPLNWSEINSEIKFEKELNSLTFSYPITLEFTGDGYNKITNSFNSSGVCTSLEIDIYKDNVLLIEGTIFMSDCSWEPVKRIVSVVVTDRSFYAKINNNKKIDVSLGSDQGKNSAQGDEIIITNPTRLTVDIDFYNGGTTTRSFYGFDLKEVFLCLVEFMSDGTMGFRSDWYDDLDADEKLLVTSGTNIRVGATINYIDPVISFYDLYTDLKKAFNLCLLYERDSDGVYYLRIEHISYISDYEKDGITLDNIADYVVRIDPEELPATIKVGCAKADGKTGVYGEIPATGLLGSEKENYYIQGECNIDYELDLELSTINCLHNDMYDIVINSSTSYDDQVFIIQYNNSTNVGVKTDAFNNGTAYVYNEVFFNNKIIERYNLQGAVAYFLEGFDSGFNATGESNIDLVSVGTVGGSNPYVANYGKLDYTTETYDPQSAYDNTNSRFVAPTATVYSFFASYNMIWCANAFCAATPANVGINTFYWVKGVGIKFIEIEFKLVHYDATVTVVKNISSDYITWPEIRKSNPYYTDSWSEYEKDSRCNYGDFTRSVNGTFNMAVGEVVQVEAVAYLRMGVDLDYRTQVFNTTYNVVEGGVFEPTAPELYRTSIIEVKKYPLTDGQITSLKNKPYQAIALQNDTTKLNDRAFVRNVSINHETNVADFELRSGKNIII